MEAIYRVSRFVYVKDLNDYVRINTVFIGEVGKETANHYIDESKEVGRRNSDVTDNIKPDLYIKLTQLRVKVDGSVEDMYLLRDVDKDGIDTNYENEGCCGECDLCPQSQCPNDVDS